MKDKASNEKSPTITPNIRKVRKKQNDIDNHDKKTSMIALMTILLKASI